MEIYDDENNVGSAPIQPIDNKNFELSNSQKLTALTRWNDESKQPPSIDELSLLVFNKKLDGRSKEVTVLKRFLVEKGLSIEKEVKTGKFTLTPEQKEYITNNCSTMKGMEMARVLFDNQNIAPAGLEMRAISNFLKTVDPKILYNGELPDDEYVAPNTADRVVARIRKYVEVAKNWDAKKLTPTQKRNVESLMNYLADFRFKFQVDSYEDKNDKELFQSSYIKYTYDKPDLSQENCDQYISLCSLIIRATKIEKNILMLEREQDRFLQDEGKISMAVVEAIKTAGTELGTCMKMQQTLLESLIQERSDKLSDEIKDKASLLNLINAWRNYDSRQNLLKLAKEKKDNLRKEIHELANLEEVKMRILGLDIDEVLNG